LVSIFRDGEIGEGINIEETFASLKAMGLSEEMAAEITNGLAQTF
jgi:hypothetical protein